MKGHFHRLRNDISGFLAGNRNRTLLLFGIEGLLFQFVYSLAAGNGIGTNLYATNLGATDTQVSMVQLLSNLLAVALLLPAGILSDRTKNSKTMPVIILLFVGVMYFFYGTVPVMGEQRMVFFFLFVSLTAGLMAIYNAIWQAFFGDVTPLADRNRVYAFRNRFVFAISTVAPILLGTILTAMPDSERKLSVLRIFFYLCGALNLLNAFVLSRIPGGRRSPEALAQIPKFSFSAFGDVFRTLLHDRRFLFYFGSIMFFYMGWHLDWTMWYIGQTQYVGLTEAQLSWYSAACAILQLLTLGIFARANEKKTVHFTFIFCVLSLMLCPLPMLVSGLAPVGLRSAVFLVLGTLVCIPQGANNLCLVQMLLEVTPEKNRSLIVSLNMAFVTLSNAVMPFVGVQLYNALGADYNAFLLFNSIAFVWRSLALCLFLYRYFRFRRRAAAA